MDLVLFILGTIVPLASVRAWGRAFPRWMLAAPYGPDVQSSSVVAKGWSMRDFV
ncbi:MAG: hypothetical protein ACRDJE_17600 [Dehalococcoidia bacterium]